MSYSSPALLPARARLSVPAGPLRVVMAVMAAVVAGMGVSASAASGASNPGTGDTGFFTFPVSSPDRSVRVNVASGNLYVRAADLTDADATYHVTLDRFYSSLAPNTDGILGPR